jgi:predicted esterase
MLREPYDTIMYVHFLWRWEWIAIGLVAAAVLVGLRVWWRPKGPSTRRQRRRLRGLDVLLSLAVAAQPVLLFWPTVDIGHDPLRPGAQVCRQYVIGGRSKPYPAATRVNYLLYLPAEYKESQKWPLVVYLHGGGASGENLLYVRAEGLTNQIERGKHFPFILLSPQSLRRGWDPELIVALIEHVSSTLPVDRDRVYLTGCSMGGFGTWNVASRYPDRFAAIVPLCGGGDMYHANRLAHVPIWAFHGAKDDRVPLSNGQDTVDAVKRCGGNVKFTIYPDAGHDIEDLTYGNDQLYEWLLAQRRSPSRQPAPAAAKATSPSQSPAGKK